MINCKSLFESFKSNGIEFYTGVPDSLLKDICAYITDQCDTNEHIIAANEGASVALATGYHLATGKIPLVYLQNSGLGNTVNPLLSLADKEVYGVPMIVMIGWRGEPGIKDEPQHIKQGRVQNALLDAMEIPYEILDTKVPDVNGMIARLVQKTTTLGTPVALVVRGDTFEPYKLIKDSITSFEMNREDAIKEVLSNLTENDIIVSTTGKSSREVFEYRVEKAEGHQNDFLTVGSMGHANQIALGIGLNTTKRVVCIDGDGAVLMHMGSLAIIGKSQVKNFIHIVINNGAHDSVGGQPTVAFDIDFVNIANACGYSAAYTISKKSEIGSTLNQIQMNNGPVFIEIKTNKGARANLGRPTKSPKENKTSLMKRLES
jgi:phosphonopyruvate decarboxylase